MHVTIKGGNQIPGAHKVSRKLIAFGIQRIAAQKALIDKVQVFGHLTRLYQVVTFVRCQGLKSLPNFALVGLAKADRF